MRATSPTMRTLTSWRVRSVNGQGWAMRSRNSCLFRMNRSGSGASELSDRVGRDEGGRGEAGYRHRRDCSDMGPQARVDVGQRLGVTSEEAAEIKRLKAEKAGLRQA